MEASGHLRGMRLLAAVAIRWNISSVRTRSRSAAGSERLIVSSSGTFWTASRTNDSRWIEQRAK